MENDLTTERIGADLIYGAEAISAEFGLPLKRVYRLLASGKLPAGKIGGIWTASRRHLREFADEMTRSRT